MVKLENPEQHDIHGWSAKAAELHFECERLREALREALDEWGDYLPHTPYSEGVRERIAELRKQFLDI